MAADAADNRSRQVWPYAVAVPLVLAAMHWPALAGRAIYFHNDLWQWFLPLHEFLRRELWAGNRLPWCPLIGLGYPLAAEPQTGLWYPLNLLLAIPLPIGLLMAWLLWLHYAVAGLGVFALARLLRVPPLEALLAALIFTTTGFMVAHLHHVPIITAAAWFPWAWFGLLAYRRRGPGGTGQTTAGRRGRRRLLALVAWCSAAQLLAGQPQVWLLTFVSGFVMLFLAEVLLRDTLLALPHEWRRRDWVSLLAASGLGLGVAGITLLPAASLYALSERSRPDLDFITSYALSRDSLKTLLGVRLSRGDYWEFEVFAGLSTLVLAALAVVRGRARAMLYLLCALVLFALFMGLAQVNPLYRLALHVPVLSGMRCAGRWVLIVSVCLALLAAYGLQVLSRPGWLRPLVVAIAVAEMMWFGAHYNPQAMPELLQPPSQAARLAGQARLLTTLPYRLPEGLSQGEQFLLGRRLVVPNLNVMWGVPAAHLYMPLQLQDFARVRDSVNWTRADEAAACGIGWQIVQGGGTGAPPGWERIPGGGDALYRLPQPRLAWLAVSPAAATPDDTVGTARLVRQSGRGLTLRCTARRPAYVVVSVVWLPWWQATVNGRPSPLERAGKAFCAVPVPAGDREIELRYRQPRLREGACLTVGSLVLLALLLLLA